jgi:CubicO group peptidase (beta-lactamase class C family)
LILSLLLLAAASAAPVARSESDPYAAVAALVERGIRQGVYPGAVVVIGRHDSVLYSRGFGHLTWARNGPVPSPTTTLWDLASLTKVMATASSVMVLVDRGTVALDAPVARYLPRFTGDGRERITVRMLLDHTSGLPAYLALHRLVTTRDSAIELLYRRPLIREPGEAELYSDLNAIVLGLLVEAVSSESLDAFAAREVMQPLGLTRTVFAPAIRTGASVAPSRKVGGRPVAGRVNDDNAFLFGGVAGQAGLFSTGSDVARFAQHWLRQGAVESGHWVAPATMQEFLRRSSSAGSPGGRVLGWDTPVAGGDTPSIYGARAGPLTYGHTGWTGTMVWIDPGRDLFMVFLTNRSLDPRVRRSLTAMRDIRSALSNLVLASAGR